MAASRFRLRVAPEFKDTVVIAGSFSKTYAMTGWRIGYVLGAEGTDRGGPEDAEPLHVESDVDFAEGGDRSTDRPAGVGRHDAGGICEAPELCRGAAARIPGVRMRANPAGRFMRIRIFPRRSQRESRTAWIFRCSCSRKRMSPLFPVKRSAPRITFAFPTRHRMEQLDRGLTRSPPSWGSRWGLCGKSGARPRFLGSLLES